MANPQVRAGVASAFVDRELDPYTFGELTTRDDVFEQVVNEAIALFWGRDYLRRVKRALKENDDDRWRTRIELLEDVL